jgi:KaiC/GvpD/RAD55 family RecA-like ATPase
VTLTVAEDPPVDDAPPHTDADWLTEWDRVEGMVHANGHAPVDEAIVAGFVDWDTFWFRDRSEADYLLEDVIVRGRGHAIYAPHKEGKSLFSLWACTQIIRTEANTVVIYLDYEMTEDDLQERLEDMGIGADTDLSRLRYWLLPTLPPLNTLHGAGALLEIVHVVAATHPEHHICVVIDTTSRAVQGEENDSTTYQEFYRLTGMRLKQMGVTWVRLDHEGKDASRGQRGSSAKGDDIDVAWRVGKVDGGVKLTRKLSRLSWVPESVAFQIGQDPLRYIRTGETVPAGTAEVIAILDGLGVSPTASANSAQRALREADEGRARQIVQAAQKSRKKRDEEGVL